MLAINFTDMKQQKQALFHESKAGQYYIIQRRDRSKII